MYVAANDFTDENYPISFYRLDWMRIDVRYGQHRVQDFPKPKHFDEMISTARILSKGLPFVRVDFFDTDEKLYVAEMTFAPGGGCVPYNPISFNKELGDLFVLPINNQGDTFCKRGR